MEWLMRYLLKLHRKVISMLPDESLVDGISQCVEKYNNGSVLTKDCELIYIQQMREELKKRKDETS